MRSKLFGLLMLAALLVALTPAVVQAAPAAEGAGKVYTIQKDDWLSKVAEKEYGNPLAYRAIVYFTNQMAETDSTLTKIADENTVEVGQSIYLPTAEEAQAYLDEMASAGLSGQLQLAGSTTVQPLAEVLAEAFTAANPNVKIDIQGGGSSVGVTSAGEGTVDIGTVSREVKDSELQQFPNLQAFTIAYDGIAIVTNPELSLATLTKEQIQGIFSGEITNFSQVGGPDGEIVVVSREEGSGTRTAFEELVMQYKDAAGEKQTKPISEKALLQQSNGQVRTTIATTPNTIGYLSFGFLDESIKAVPVADVAPTTENVLNGSYPIFRPLIMLTNGAPNELSQAFLDFTLGQAGQAIVSEDYISVAAEESSADLSGQLQMAGSTTVQPLAEVLAEAFTAKNPNVKIDIQGGGSSVGITSAAEGTVDIGTVSREVKDTELQQYPNLKVFTIAYDGIAVITNPELNLTTLTKEQIQGIFSGEITNFSQVGGPDAQIVVVSREEGSGTRTAFEELVMQYKDAAGEKQTKPISEKALLQQSNGQVRTTVATTPNTIGYLSFGFLDESVKAVPVADVAPTTENVLNGSYPIFRPLNMLTNGAPNQLSQAFLDFTLGAEGQAIVGQDYISINK